MNWQPISGAPKDGALIQAKDADDERSTWFIDGDWWYEGWRENADREEYRSEEHWEPRHWLAPAPDTSTDPRYAQWEAAKP